MPASILRSTVLALGLVAAPFQAHADAEFRTPPPASAERRAILAAMRPQVEAAYQLKVKFSVRALASNGSVALVFAEPMNERGQVIGERTTKTARGETLELDGWVFAIVKRESKLWRVVEIDLLSSVDGLTIWPAQYPEIPKGVFEGAGVATRVLPTVP
jgi:hypothetical protein